MFKFLAGLVLGLIAGIVGAIVGVFVFLPEPSPSLPPNVYGRFIGKLNPEWLEDGRRMKLNDDFVFIDPNRLAWTAPAGSEIDGASIPQAVWSIVGGPFEGRYRNASVVHDVACVEKNEPSDKVHIMFYFACRCAGVSESKAKAMYFAVAKYGPTWELTFKPFSIDGKQMMACSAHDETKARELTTDDATTILQFFEANSNVPLEDIPATEIPGL